MHSYPGSKPRRRRLSCIECQRKTKLFIVKYVGGGMDPIRAHQGLQETNGIFERHYLKLQKREKDRERGKKNGHYHFGARFTGYQGTERNR